MAIKQPAGITNGELSDTATLIYGDAFKNDGYAMFSLAERAIAEIEARKIKDQNTRWGCADFLFNSIRWNLRNHLDRIKRLPDAEKKKMPDGRFREESLLTSSIQLLEDGAVHYFLNEFVGFYEGKNIAEISRSCSANMRKCKRAELWFLYGAFEECKKETDICINEATAEYEAKKAIGYFDHQDANRELTKEEKLLAKLCPLFGSATHDTKRKVWSKLLGFTRNQWALFLIDANPKQNKYVSKTAAAKELIKPNAHTIEEINGLTNMRGIVITEGSNQYAKDCEKVREIIQLLKADSVMRRA